MGEEECFWQAKVVGHLQRCVFLSGYRFADGLPEEAAESACHFQMSQMKPMLSSPSHLSY